MDFEDEMHDTTDIYYLVELFNSDSEMASDEDDDDAGVLSDTDDSDDSTLHQQQQQNYTILNMEDICQRQEADITNISTVLSISRVDATVLLIHYNWSVDHVHNAWFTDEQHVRRKVGLLKGPVIEISNVNELTCMMCFYPCPRDMMIGAACGHLFCTPCWKDYVSNSINNGPGCLMLRCPIPPDDCGAAVDQDMINRLVSNEDRQKYDCHLLGSYVELNRKIKWCPAVGCDYAVEYLPESRSFDVVCKCTYRFCWNCDAENHRPVDCSTAAKWILKSSDDTDNLTWLFVHSKPCPQCRRIIARDEGCMHMKCPCNYEFCWMCLGVWSSHSYATGGYYECQTYEKSKLEGASIETEQKKEMFGKDLERYTYYYERWASYQSLIQKAMTNLQEAQSVKIRLDLPLSADSALNIITKAWLQIIECSRVLKWSYVYAYYSVLDGVELVKRRFLEFQQGVAESFLEKFHQFAEKELERFVSSFSFKESTYKELVRFTRITRNYFQMLVLDIEEGFLEVQSSDVGVEVEDSKWSCDYCCYENLELSHICEVCEQSRKSEQLIK